MKKWAVLAGLLLPYQAMADGPGSASDLLTVCESKDDGCLFYLMGFVKGHEVGELDQFFKEAGPNRAYLDSERTICVPPRVDAKRLRLVFLKHARNEPERLHHDPRVVLAETFRAAFPCPSK